MPAGRFPVPVARIDAVGGGEHDNWEHHDKESLLLLANLMLQDG